ncbi:MAG: hypothetical protein HYX26_05050 [Acidobacteriales bacterium]|nr:hypothetical protein [Terriglobales bacterium]
MLRVIIFGVVVASLLVFLRLMLLSIRRGPQPRRAPVREDKIIDAEEPVLELKSYRFHGCDSAMGPPDPLDFHERLYVSVGPRDSDRARTYCIHVTTPKTLEKELSASGHPARFGRDLLIVHRFEVDVILRAVRDRIRELNELGESLD